jgi:hypothetical protein
LWTTFRREDETDPSRNNHKISVANLETAHTFGGRGKYLFAVL